MTKAYTIAGGWLSEVYGHPVRRVDLTYLDHTRYWSGAPHGVMWHYTAGCGTNLQGVAESRGYNICTLSIDLDGVVYQYLPLDYAAWHAYDASYNYIGVEHSGLPGSCNLTPTQRDASVRLFAALVVWHQDHYGRRVAVDHAGGCSLDPAALKEHRDGIGCSWNPKTHTDGLDPAGWEWGSYLEDITAMIGGEEEDMTKEQADQLDKLFDWVRMLVQGINAGNPPGADATGSAKAGYNAGQRVLGTWQWQDGYTAGTQGKDKPSDPEAAKGWQAARAVTGSGQSRS